MIKRRQTNPTTFALPERVLIVEDDAILGLSLEVALEDAGVPLVEVCTSAMCTLQKLKTDDYDAIVLDVHLPDSDEGWEIAEIIDTLGGTKTRIIFQTGSPDDIPEHIKELGPVLEKPFAPAELVALLQEPKRKGLIARLRNPVA